MKKISSRMVVIVVVLVAVLVVAVYAVTTLLTQSTPRVSITRPGAGTIVGNCSTLTLPVSSVAATTDSQSGNWAGTCNGQPAVNVTTTGTFLIEYAVESGCCGGGYSGVVLMNYTGIPNPTPSSCFGTRFGLEFGGSSHVISKGEYYYCLSWYLSSYSANTPSYFPTVVVTWSSP